MTELQNFIREHGVLIRDVRKINARNNKIYAFGCKAFWSMKWVKAELRFDEVDKARITETRYFHLRDFEEHRDTELAFKWFCYFYTYIVRAKYGQVFVKQDN